jgi:hypothetical protein
MKIKIGRYIFQTYPVSEVDIPEHWIYFEKIRLFKKTIGCYWFIEKK